MEEQNFARFVGVLNRQSQAYINIAFKKMDISYSECIFLTNLYDNEGINQEELSSLLFIDKAITAKSIKSLEKKEFLSRKISDKDKRAKKIYLTDKGRNYKEQVFSLLNNWLNSIMNGMNEEDKNIFFKGLKCMSKNAVNADLNGLLDYKENNISKSANEI